MSNRFVSEIQEMWKSRAPVDGYSIDTIFENTSLEDDSDVAEAITFLSRELDTEVSRLNQLLQSIEWLAESDASIDAAIEAEYFREVRGGVDSLVAAERLYLNHPELETQIHRAIRCTVDISEAASALGMVQELPVEFGRMEHDLRPRYQLLEMIGTGQQGTVYRAVDRRFDQGAKPALVAVKICRFHLAGDEEAACARAINHPNVARVVDRGVEAGNPYLVYELIEGVSLDQWVKQHPHASWQERCELVAAIADGVHAAHASGVIHRDLKPTNILVRPNGVPVITDFGISCRHQDGRPYVYQSSETVMFLSPEQFARTPMGRAPTTDVYSLGGLLFWLMTGQCPNGASVRDAVYALTNESLSLDHLNTRPIGPRRLETIWSRSLDSDSTKRHRSAEQFATDLRAVLDHQPIAWINTTRSSKVPLFLRRNALTSSLIAAGLALLIGGAWNISGSEARAELEKANLVIELQKEQIANVQLYLSQLSDVLQSQGIRAKVE